MKTGKKKWISFVLVMVMLFTMIAASGSVTYAADPEIIIEPSDIWLWPDETRTIGIALTDSADSVKLEFLSWDTNVWYEFADCKYQDSGKSIWYYDIPPKFTNTNEDFEYYEILRYAIKKDSKTIYSEDFIVTWTNAQGFDRIAGTNRYETAMLAADAFMSVTERPYYRNVIIASGLDFADALGGTYLAVCRDAPILLVNKNPQVIQDVAVNVQKNLIDGGQIYILGGYGAVSEEMEKALLAGGFEDWQITRFAGKNRYETNLMILRACGPVGKDILVCSGTNFADALSASAVGLPILLVGKSLTQEQKDFLSICDPQYVNVIGGEGAVSKAVFDTIHNELNCMGYRIWGANRYETSAMIAMEYFTTQQRYTVTLAYGQNFPDGLAGGPLSYQIGAPLLLVRAGNEQYACDVVKYGLHSRHAVVLGGQTLISDQLVKKILDTRAKG